MSDKNGKSARPSLTYAILVIVPVVCYHSVDPDWDSPLAVLPQRFERQCAWLSRHKVVIPAREHARLAGPSEGKRAVTSLTFDDGFAALYDHALSSLVRHGLPATVLIVAGSLEGGVSSADWLQPRPSQDIPLLNRDQVLEMQAAGVEFGSHSWAHHDLRKLSEEECVRDLKDSREALEDLLKQRVPLLAYPYGFHEAHVRRAARIAGYESALSLPAGPEPTGQFALPRVGVYRRNILQTVKVKTSERYLAHRTGTAGPSLQRLIAASRMWRSVT
jgi:peptidoglycan/xylan/chitin deacetylase (PgdA/CDA1 family)